MTFEELFDKYLQEDSFKKEVKELLENDDLKAVISRYDLPYSEEELASLISERAETANCKDKKREAELKAEIAKYENLRDHAHSEAKRLKDEANKCTDPAARTQMITMASRFMEEYYKFDKKIDQLRTELDNL